MRLMVLLPPLLSAFFLQPKLTRRNPDAQTMSDRQKRLSLRDNPPMAAAVDTQHTLQFIAARVIVMFHSITHQDIKVPQKA
jgi:hypothetical protein